MARGPLVRRRAFAFGLAASGLSLAACDDESSRGVSVYCLLDVSASYFRELDKALRALRVMMGFVRAHDSFAVAEIGGCSFTDDAVLLRFTAPDRPSERQRLVASSAQRLAEYAARAKPTNFTDVRGALIQAVQVLDARPAAQRTIVVFSDMEEELPPNCRRDAALPAGLRGMKVVAANVTRLPEDNRDPARYARRLDGWRRAVEGAGAAWQVVADPADLVSILKDRP